MSDNYAWASLVEALSRQEPICTVSSMWAVAEKYVETITENERESMKFVKTFLVALVVALLLGFIGCVGFQDIITPCHIDEAAIEYSGQKATSYVPWTTMWDAKRIRGYLNLSHIQYQNACDRLKQDDSLTHAFLLDGVDTSIADSTQFQETVFNPTGPVGLMVSGLGFGTLGAILIKRPGDKSKKEVELEKSVPA